MEVLALLAILFILGLVWSIGTINRLNRLKMLVREAWAQVDVALKRRYDLIPNLVETVRASSNHESELLERLIQARNEAVGSGGGAATRLPLETAFVSALNGLWRHVETYPNLRSNENFLSLQRELANTEDRIAAARRFYNANVRDYNIAQEQFPSALFAAGHEKAEFFEIDEMAARQPVSIKPF